MRSIKRKSDENPPGETPQKQLRENGLVERVDDEPVACLHDVCYPEGYIPSFSSARQGFEPAKVFPFTLDPFQSEAIKCLEDGESVMVSFLLSYFSAVRVINKVYCFVIRIVFNKISSPELEIISELSST